MHKLRTPQKLQFFSHLHFNIQMRFPQYIKIDFLVHRLYRDDPPMRRYMLLNVRCMGGTDHYIIIIEIPVIVLCLPGKSCIGIRITLDLDPHNAIGQHHDNIRTRLCNADLL